MNYQELGKKILPLVGGIENINGFTNCMTRLRINIRDKDLVNAAEIKAIKGVLGVLEGDQLQIIVGPGHAQRAKDAFETVTGLKGDAEVDGGGAGDVAADMKAKVKASQQSPFQRGLKHVGSIFIPLIPGFVGTGLIAAIANVIKIASPGVVANPWYLLFAAMGGLLVSTLHIVVGYNAGKEFGGTPVLGAIAGALIFAPALAGIAAKGDVAAIPLVLPVLNITLKAGLGGVIGVIFATYVFVAIEKQVRKIVPAILDLFLVPLITILLGSVVTLFVIMPLAAQLMNLITYLLIDIALLKGGIVGGYVLSATFLPLVMLGIHHGLTPVHADLIKETGQTVLLPILAMAGAGQVGSAIAVYLKTKDKGMRELIGSALPAGFLGVGEPLIYGVSLPLFYPFITACLGAGFGGALIALAPMFTGGLSVGAIAIGPSGLVLLPLINNGLWLWYLAGLIASYTGGFLLTYFFGFKEEMLERLK
ncbi:MAG: PTS transporter subunit EIIC [Culicoidibacterales bacterium]